MVENDAVNVTAYVRIYKDPTGVLWHNFIKLVFCPQYYFMRLLRNLQLRLEKRDWYGGPEEPRCHLLFELTSPVALFHKRIPQGRCRG